MKDQELSNVLQEARSDVVFRTMAENAQATLASGKMNAAILAAQLEHAYLIGVSNERVRHPRSWMWALVLGLVLGIAIATIVLFAPLEPVFG